MEKIPTIEEFANKRQPAHDHHSKDLTAQGYIHFMSLAIDFAKYHVEAALKAAAENATSGNSQFGTYVNKESILNAYPLDNIK